MSLSSKMRYAVCTLLAMASGSVALQSSMLVGSSDGQDEDTHLDDFQKQTTKQVFQFPEQSSSNRSEDIQFVHVGKTGGTSIKRWFDKNNVSYKEYHVCNAPTKSDIEGTDKWVISVRDPIDRVISAFNWRHPVGGRKHVNYKLQCNHNAYNESDIYECFDTVNDLAEAVEDDTSCGAIARTALTTPIDSVHLAKGLVYYVGSVVHLLRHKAIQLVHSDNMQSDMEHLCAKVSKDCSQLRIPHSLEDYPLKNKTLISSKGHKLLQKALRDEYDLLETLEKMA